MLFYPSNLVVNIKLSKVNVQYLDLFISIDDVTISRGKFHFRTYFKKFHKFAYFDPLSDHPHHVFRGIVKTECIRYIRNSSGKDDYLNSLRLFKMRLLKLGYTNKFIDKNMVKYNSVVNYPLMQSRKESVLNKVFCFVQYYRSNKAFSVIKEILRRARTTLNLSKELFLVGEVMPKLRNVISTRRILHDKMKNFDFRFV